MPLAIIDSGTGQADAGLGHQFNGTVTDDGLPSGEPLSVVWFLDDGPGTVNFDDSTAIDPVVTFSEPGTYVFELLADDTEFFINDLYC